MAARLARSNFRRDAVCDNDSLCLQILFSSLLSWKAIEGRRMTGVALVCDVWLDTHGTAMLELFIDNG
jgi:hypothetical protein